MTRLIFFIVLSLFFIMALLPLRMTALADYGHPYSAGEQEHYFTCMTELQRLKAAGVDEDKAHKATLDVARALTGLRRYQAADQLYREVWQARANSTAAYDETFVSAVMGLAGLRRDTSKIANAISCYSAALQYDKKHLPSGDIRLTRDKNNLAVALLIAGKTATTAEKRILYLKSAAGFLVEVIADQKQRSPQGSVREANAHQDLAYALKTMGDKRGYEKEIELSLSMKHRLNPVSLCREP